MQRSAQVRGDQVDLRAPEQISVDLRAPSEQISEHHGPT